MIILRLPRFILNAMTLCADSYPWNNLKVERGTGGFRKEMPYRTSTDRGDWITIRTNILNT